MEIKAIQCPKCGSTQKTEVRANRFRCESCGTEYVLETAGTGSTPGDARTIVAPPEPEKLKPIVLVAVFALCILVLTLTSMWYSGRPRWRTASAAPSSGTAEKTATLPAFEWEWSETTVYHTVDNRAILLSIGNRRDQGSTGTGTPETYAVFADAVTGKKIQSVKLSHVPPRADVRIREFSSGDVYLIADNRSIYRADKNNFTVTDVTQTLFDKQAGLANGVARIEFLPYEQEDGLKLVTNDGATLNFFPLVHKVYGNDELWQAEKGFSNLLPGAVEKSGFTFCYFFTYDHNDAVQRQQLIKYRYMDNVGGPKSSPGVLPKGVNDQNQKGPRVISYTDFTPGRFYFSEKMFYYDADYVLIGFKPTAAVNDGPPEVQCFDARTGKILFTVQLPDATNLSTCVRSAAGFSIVNYNSVYNLGLDGKINHLTQAKDYEF